MGFKGTGIPALVKDLSFNFESFVFFIHPFDGCYDSSVMYNSSLKLVARLMEAHTGVNFAVDIVE